jgi:hypothetical protein
MVVNAMLPGLFAAREMSIAARQRALAMVQLRWSKESEKRPSRRGRAQSATFAAKEARCETMFLTVKIHSSKVARDDKRHPSNCSSRTIVLEIRPLTVRELVISTANCHSCGEQNCNDLRAKTLMSTDCR